MTPEHAVEYLETLSRRHGLGGLSEKDRAATIAMLWEHPDIIHRFIRESEARIEQVSQNKEVV